MFIVTVLCSMLVAANVYAAAFDPSSGEDWTALVPKSSSLPGSFSTLPFRFGIVVNPYHVNDEGEFIKPPISSVTRSLYSVYESTQTSTFTLKTEYTLTTSLITAAPKPTRNPDVKQIQDGQVQRVGDGSKGKFNTISFSQAADDYDHPNDSDDEIEYILEKSNAHEDEFDSEDSSSESDYEDTFQSPVYAVACLTNSTLKITLTDSILRDEEDRIGSIVGSRQFQFDGPVPQYGAIYAAGWSVTSDGQLALGGSTKFYQCSSGGFYNIYDQHIAPQCSPVILDVIELINCDNNEY